MVHAPWDARFVHMMKIKTVPLNFSLPMSKQNKLERFPLQVFSGHANIPGYIIKDMLTQQDLVAK